MFEGKSVAYIAGFIVGILIAVGIWFLVAVFLKKGCKTQFSKKGFDERQLIARGQAAKVGFFTLCAWEVFSALLKSAVENMPFSESLWHFFGLFVGLTAFIIACVWKDAYYQVTEQESPQKRNFYVIAIIAGLANVVLFFVNGGFNKLIYEGKIRSMYFCNFLIGVLVIILLINLFAKELADKRKTEKGEQE